MVAVESEASDLLSTGTQASAIDPSSCQHRKHPFQDYRIDDDVAEELRPETSFTPRHQRPIKVPRSPLTLRHIAIAPMPLLEPH
jgi:hypothetical protein